MRLTQKQIEIYEGKRCPYCHSTTKVVSEEFIYGKKYKEDRSMICCARFPECDSYVGTHKDDGTTLGRLANRELRMYKMRTHEWFDRIWQENYKERTEAYEWLADQLGIPDEYTHVGMFSIKTCKRAIKICIAYFEELEAIAQQLRTQK